MRKVFTMDELRTVAPSVFAQGKAGKCSEKYRYIPTSDVVEGLMQEGFYPTFAKQQNTRQEGRQGFQKHLLRFTHEKFLETAKEYHPEIVLVNSHDATSAYHLYFGIFRLVCENGLVVMQADLGGLSVRHQGKIVDNVIEASYKLIDEAPAIQNKVEAFGQIMLPEPKRIRFAEQAYRVKWRERTTVEPSALLIPRRAEDDKKDLWTTLNVVQENLIKGGLDYTMTGRNNRVMERHTRKVNGVNETVTLNCKLWELADEVYRKEVA